MEDSFDPEKLRCVEPAPPKPAARPRIPRSTIPFVKVPRIWIEVLATIPNATAATYQLALHLIKEGWKSPNHVVKLTNSTAGISRWTKYRELSKLRKSGLVAVEQRGRKSPLVTVRHLV
jgi:hypothetical protein